MGSSPENLQYRRRCHLLAANELVVGVQALLNVIVDDRSRQQRRAVDLPNATLDRSTQTEPTERTPDRQEANTESRTVSTAKQRFTDPFEGFMTNSDEEGEQASAEEADTNGSANATAGVSSSGLDSLKEAMSSGCCSEDGDVAAIKQCVHEVFMRIKALETDRHDLLALNQTLHEQVKEMQEATKESQRENVRLQGEVAAWKYRYSICEDDVEKHSRQTWQGRLRKAILRQDHLRQHNRKLQLGLRQVLQQQHMQG